MIIVLPRNLMSAAAAAAAVVLLMSLQLPFYERRDSEK
jgi:hypothetical protein